MTFSTVRRLGAGLGLALALLTAANAASVPPQPAKPVDLTRYAGRWYEVARLPNHIQDGCALGSIDWDRAPDGGAFAITQKCRMDTAEAREKTWHATGRIMDAPNNTKIHLSFFAGLISQDYWVLDRGDDYSWCILSTPSPKYLWILSRHPVVSAAQKAAMVARAHDMGFDTSRLIFDHAPPSS
jgi:apolipoprotein D and lipocalin family protein